MEYTKLMRRTAKALQDYRVSIIENYEIELQVYLFKIFESYINRMLEENPLLKQIEAIDILNEMIKNKDYE